MAPVNPQKPPFYSYGRKKQEKGAEGENERPDGTRRTCLAERKTLCLLQLLLQKPNSMLPKIHKSYY